MRRWAAAVVAGVALAGVVAGAGAGAASARAGDGAPRAAQVTQAVAAAARTERVPRDLLLATGWVATHWRMPAQRSVDHGWGVMDLREGTRHGLARAARLTGRSQRELRRDLRANVRGEAALLSRLAGSRRRPATLGAWRRTVAALHGAAFADQVFSLLARGATLPLEGAAVRLPARPGLAPPAAARSAQLVPADQPFAVWSPASTSNFTWANRPYDHAIDTIVIHATEGSYGSSLSWLANPRARASAHFLVRSADGAVAQLVREHDIAWHAGNWDVNERSIGIEHEAFTRDCSWYTAAMYAASARLVAALAQRYAIPVDRAHIIGHAEVPDPNHPGQYGGASHHTDPGPCWNWDAYLAQVRANLATLPPAQPATTPPPFDQVVDNGNPVRFTASRAWRTARRARGKRGADYRYARPRPLQDAARYRFAIPVAGTYAVYARWPRSRSASAAAPYGILTAQGLRWVRVDQRRHGGRWTYLGRFPLRAGDADRVLVSRWTSAKGSLVADAVRIRNVPLAG